MKLVLNKIITLSIICLVFIVHSSFSQEDYIYFDFNGNTKEFFIKEDGSGKKVKEPLYSKNKKINGDIMFYIEDQMFVYDKSINSKYDRQILNTRVQKHPIIGPSRESPVVGIMLSQTFRQGITGMSNVIPVQRF